MSKTIAFDFDGVLHTYESGWTGSVPIDPPVPGARACVEAFVAAGFEVVVFTCRAHADEGRRATSAWLAAHGFPACEVTAIKPHALLYVDDRAFRFEGSWEALLAMAGSGTPRPWTAPVREIVAGGIAAAESPPAAPALAKLAARSGLFAKLATEERAAIVMTMGRARGLSPIVALEALKVETYKNDGDEVVSRVELQADAVAAAIRASGRYDLVTVAHHAGASPQTPARVWLGIMERDAAAERARSRTCCLTCGLDDARAGRARPSPCRCLSGHTIAVDVPAGWVWRGSADWPLARGLAASQDDERGKRIWASHPVACLWGKAVLEARKHFAPDVLSPFHRDDEDVRRLHVAVDDPDVVALVEAEAAQEPRNACPGCGAFVDVAPLPEAHAWTCRCGCWLMLDDERRVITPEGPDVERAQLEGRREIARRIARRDAIVARTERGPCALCRGSIVPGDRYGSWHPHRAHADCVLEVLQALEEELAGEGAFRCSACDGETLGEDLDGEGRCPRCARHDEDERADGRDDEPTEGAPPTNGAGETTHGTEVGRDDPRGAVRGACGEGQAGAGRSALPVHRGDEAGGGVPVRAGGDGATSPRPGALRVGAPSLNLVTIERIEGLVRRAYECLNLQGEARCGECEPCGHAKRDGIGGVWPASGGEDFPKATDPPPVLAPADEAALVALGPDLVQRIVSGDRDVKPPNVLGADECPVAGCGAWVPGIDASEMHEGAEHRCKAGHDLSVVVSDGKAWLVPFGGVETKTPRERYVEAFVALSDATHAFVVARRDGSPGFEQARMKRDKARANLDTFQSFRCPDCRDPLSAEDLDEPDVVFTSSCCGTAVVVTDDYAHVAALIVGARLEHVASGVVGKVEKIDGRSVTRRIRDEVAGVPGQIDVVDACDLRVPDEDDAAISKGQEEDAAELRARVDASTPDPYLSLVPADETVAPGTPASSGLAFEAWWSSWSKARRSKKRKAKKVTACCACHAPILAETTQAERGTTERMHEACWLKAKAGNDPRRAKGAVA